MNSGNTLCNCEGVKAFQEPTTRSVVLSLDQHVLATSEREIRETDPVHQVCLLRKEAAPDFVCLVHALQFLSAFSCASQVIKLLKALLSIFVGLVAQTC